MRIAIDTGGTFTDCVYLNNGAPAVLKLLSTPGDPAKSVLEAIRAITARVGAALQARPEVPLTCGLMICLLTTSAPTQQCSSPGGAEYVSPGRKSWGSYEFDGVPEGRHKISALGENQKAAPVRRGFAGCTAVAMITTRRG